MVVVHGQADLFEVVGALDPAGGLAGRLNGRQQKSDQHGDNRDHDEKFNQREASMRIRFHKAPPLK